MNTKKFIVSLISVLCFSATIGTISASAYDDVYSNPYSYNGYSAVTSHSFRFTQGTYAYHYGFTTHTAIGSKTGDTTSTKNVSYNVFRVDSIGQNFSVGSASRIDTTSSVVTDGINPPSNAVRREHVSIIYPPNVYPEYFSAVVSNI